MITEERMKRTEGVREGQPRVNEKSNTYEPKERERQR